MKKKLAILNSDPITCSYGGVAPIMKNLDPYLQEAFDVKYFFLSEKEKRNILPGRLKVMLMLWRKRKELSRFDFILSHVPEGSFVTSFTGVPYCHVYHGNDNPMKLSRYRFGKYFAFVFDIFFKRIEKTSVLKYTVGPVWGDKKKLFNPVRHSVTVKPISERSGFIYAGRLESMKHIDRLITIYSKIPEQIRDTNDLYIAGNGTQLQNLKTLAAKSGLESKVHFLGALPNEILIETDSTKKILLMTSSHEGLPTAIAEAFSVGVPVISTNPGDIARVLKNDYNGYIFPLDFQDEDYIQGIVKILTDYDRFSRNALESSAIFKAETIARNIIGDINEIIRQQC